MCCRFYIEDRVDDFSGYFEQVSASPLTGRMAARLARPLKTAGEIFPTDMVPVVAADRKGAVRAFPMVWGFTAEQTGKRRLLINARAETAASTAAFREAWNAHRCIVPASFFFEWGAPPAEGAFPLTKAGKARYRIHPAGKPVTWLAGLYRTETAGDLTYPVFTILTRESAGDMRAVHGRMPVIFPDPLVEEWILPQNDPARLIDEAVTDLLVTAG